MKRIALALALTVAACGSDKTDVARVSLERAEHPAGERPNVLDNALHEIHLAGTTPVTCASCHGVFAATFEVPSPARCIACHEKNEQALHGKQLPCTDCHQFAADATGSETDCQRCHAEAQGKFMAIKAHAKIDCRSCHRPHGPESLAIEPCVTCHEDHQQDHGPDGQSLVERCSQCHPPHTKSIEAVARCRECHQQKLVRAVFRGHDKCETCHGQDRQSAPAKRIACKTCHGGRVALAANRVPEHGRCESCHAPHDPRGTALQSCRRCHSRIAPKHPGAGRSGSCLGCHPAHPRAAGRSVAACSSCHKKARTDTSFHVALRTKCTDCHESHNFTPNACKTCHQKQSRQTAGAKGHGECKSCHESAHAPKARQATCGRCHVSEYKTAGQGHRDCAKCHEPHGGARLPSARCDTCHAERRDTTHGRIDGGCKTCHRAHGPGGRARPPSCTTCHQRKRLPGLHAVDDHGKCTTCHRGHGMRELSRKTCLENCHPKQVDHERVAKTCVGCHPFGASR